MLSIIVPTYNEEESVGILIQQLYDKLVTFIDSKNYELIFVDDGSTDNTFEELKKFPDIKIIRFQRNYGKSAALAAGFEYAKGDIIIQMDADLQDDANDIPNFLEAIKTYDMVNGWRYNRQDRITKKLVSKIYNWLTSKMVGLDLHDYNCGFKCYRKEVVESLDIYGEQHRYLPALAHFNGFKVGEIQVEHHKREYGVSKYKSARILRGLMDLISIKYLELYSKRPLHFFGAVGLVFLSLGGISGLYLLLIKILQNATIGNRPLLLFTIVLLIFGIQFISLGLLGEMITKNSPKKKYIIKEAR